MYTGCDLADSALYTFVISGQLTASPSPAVTCCAQADLTYPNAGTYGPMGGGLSRNFGQLLVKLQIQFFNNGGSTLHYGFPTYPFGDPTSTITLSDRFFIGKPTGGALYFERSALQGSWTCTGSSHLWYCPYPGYSANQYAVTGTQTVTVLRGVKTLQLRVLPINQSHYLGDSLTFSAYSTDGKAVSAREWIWVDSSGTQSSVPCSVTPSSCRFAPASGGTMYVRARVGTNPYIEQASASADLLPLRLIATPTPKAVGVTLDSVKVLVRTLPHRELSSITITFNPGLMSLRASGFSNTGSATCSASAGECELSGGQAPSTLTVTATTVDGVTLTTTTVVDQLPCPTGNPVLDSKEMRALVDSIWKLGGDQPTNAANRRERGALLIDSAGVLVARFIPMDTNSSPCTTTWPTAKPVDFIQPNWQPDTMKIVSVLHTHPFKATDTIPANCPGNLAGQGVGRGPSYPDWHMVWWEQNVLNSSFKSSYGVDLFAPHYQPVVVEPDHLWLINPRSTRPWKTHAQGSQTLYMTDSVVVGDNLQGWRRSKPLNINGCVTRANTTPTLIR